MNRLESGQVEIKVPIVIALCTLYGTGKDETDELIALAPGTKDRGWWQAYDDVVPGWFRLYVSLEAAADRICTFDESVVPGELQTGDYARALYAADLSDRETIDRHVRLRLERQAKLFDRTPPPQMIAVLGEGALRRTVGGGAVLEAQIAHLRELDRREGVEIRVLTFESGAHPATTGAFRVLDFTDPDDPNVAYLETQVGAWYLEQPAELTEYRRLFDALCQQAVPIGKYEP
ncbi:transcriptional regulator [Virgisporangium aliadipatigenens]|uniref:Transcriptional regulator n=2 Tax=Virgisporangium aliadipatigenens TaxID=741659 RepID=A0A8J3YTP1_9ACTN|nr:transcriptional regulator [Virgisporangium aliadipatigenens]